MRKLTALLLVIILVSGCKTTFKSSFRNFNAYYNTFYNAKKSYESGLEKSESQQRNYNTLQPIRVFRTPLGAGAADFQNSIEKGADILRKYDETKWVDDALEIIGKSYFYRREYFSAEQKFEELYISTEDIELKQRAVFWKGRVLLELQAFNQGVQYLTEELAEFDDQWNNELRYMVQTVLAEHYVEREDYVNALDLLNESVRYLPKKEEKERGYFLIGQLNEYLGDPEAAFAAYDKVEDHYTNYDLQFEALKKKAEVARVLGNSDEAYSVLARMVRDDKNTEYVAELNYELGKTEQDRGNYKKAEEIYKRLLRNRLTRPEPVVRAMTYNGLAELNRYYFNNYTLAAAYYDSAASVNAPADQLPDDFLASENAKSFGEYSLLKQDLALKDSLLWLGSLPEAKFDSVLKELEQKKRKELEQLQKEQEARRNTLINVNDQNEQGQNNETSSENGFLNIKNPVLLAEASQQFKALWDNRPLADNWRVSRLLVREIERSGNGDELSDGNTESSENEVFINIDLSNIPFTASDQDSMREEMAVLNYQMGNLFFLSLNFPDSAEIYFTKVINERPGSSVEPVTLYSLSELYLIENEEDKAVSVAEELIRKYPNSVYADRVVEKYGIERPAFTSDTDRNIRERYLSIAYDVFLPDSLRLSSLKSFEMEYRPDALAGRALRDVISIQMKMASDTSSTFDERFVEWQDAIDTWEQRQEDFQTLKDSAEYYLQNDSTLTGDEEYYYMSLSDSTLEEPDFSDLFPYRGAAWDSVRSSIDLYMVHYSGTKESGRYQTLKAEFALPSEPVIADAVESESQDPEVSEGYLSCSELGQELFIRGGRDVFLDSVDIPESANAENISFLFFVNERGIIDEFKLSSDTRNEDLISAFIRAIDDRLTFEPVLVEGEAASVQCDLTFTIPQ